MNPSQNYECGLLVEGFNRPPVLMMTYNPRYYPRLIESAGYGKAKDLLEDEQYQAYEAMRQQIASAINVVIQVSRLSDGARKVTSISEIVGMEGDVIVMQEVFTFEQTGVVDGPIQGVLRPTGIRPKFTEKFEVMGISLPPALFGYQA